MVASMADLQVRVVLNLILHWIRTEQLDRMLHDLPLSLLTPCQYVETPPRNCRFLMCIHFQILIAYTYLYSNVFRPSNSL